MGILMVQSRQIIKQHLRLIAEVAITAVLGKGIPRRLRRQSGRAFANESYRKLNALQPLKGANPAVTDWIVKEFNSLRAALPEVPPEQPIGD